MVIVLDSLLIGGIKFVLGKVAAAVDQEMNDETRLREDLLAAQMQRELGEITDEEFVDREAAVLARLREIREEREAAAPPPDGTYTVSGIEATFAGEEHEPE